MGSGIMALASLGEGYTKAGAYRAQGDFEQQQGDLNARLSMMRAEDAIRRGDESVTEYQKKIAQMKGTQRANLAAQGIALDTGSALEIQQQTAEIAAKDVVTIKNNAWREAWGLEVEAMNHRNNGRMAALTAEHNANSALLTGGMKAIGYGYEAADKAGWFKKSKDSSSSWYSGDFSV